MESVPTQELPSWLSYSTTIVTNNAGDPVSTSATLLTLPLTYYGPSIPLGTDGVWVYGGLSSPTAPSASLSTPHASSSITSPPVSTTFSAPRSSSSTLSSPLSSSSILMATSNASSSHLTKNEVGAIVGSVIGAVVLLILALVLLRYMRNRQRRSRSGHDLLTPSPVRHSRHSRSSGLVVEEGLPTFEIKEPRETIWTGWSMVHSSGSRSEGSAPPIEADWTLVNDDGTMDRNLGEGSPRGSGEETDSFLRKSTKAISADLIHGGSSARLVSIASIPPGANSSTQNSTGTTSTGASGYGTVLDPSISHFNAAHAVSQWGQILPPSVLLRMADDNPIRQSTTIKEEDEQNSPLLPPAPLDPDGVGHLASKRSQSSFKSAASVQYPGTPHSWDEAAELMTARKIRVDEMDRADARQIPSPTSEPGSSRFLGGPFAALGRMSWFRRISGGAESPRSRPSSYVSRVIPDGDTEAGRAMLGLGPEGIRPVSGLSAKSGSSSNGTIYHDAHSRPGTPLPIHPPVAVTNKRSRLSQTDASLIGLDSPSVRVVEREQPPAYDESILDAASSTVRDVLDSPAPRPASPFASSTSITHTSAPPGLENSRSWQESLSTLGGSNAGSAGSAGITIDVLEEEPPAAGERWRSLTGGPDQRATFGVPPLYVHPRDATRSHHGSLHSVTSHLSPLSASNSVLAVSNHHTPESSFSSQHSRARTGESSGASLATSGSISSDGQRRIPQVGDPTLPGSLGRMSVGATGANATRLVAGSSIPPSPLNPRYDSLSSMAVSVDRGSNITTETVDPVSGAVIHLPRVPAWGTSVEHDHNRPWNTDIPE